MQMAIWPEPPKTKMPEIEEHTRPIKQWTLPVMMCVRLFRTCLRIRVRMY